MGSTEDYIINMSYSYFSQRNATPDLIHEYIERMKRFFSDETVDDVELFRKLEALHSVIIPGGVKILEDSTNHEEWFNPDTNLPIKRNFQWHFWDHFKIYLTTERHWPANVVQGIDHLSGQILSRMEDPMRQGTWDRRGMVVGNVQAGKTANYTALITKATDAGYKLFIVLAGVHNSLRSQTQERLNEEFLGYDLDIVQKATGQEKRIGVRRLFKTNHKVVNTLTSNAQDGDFKTAVARNAGIIPSATGDPIILVVKKNVTILNNIIEWATSLGHPDGHGRRVVGDIPLLLIDDECDYASVNTKKVERDENGKINAEWDPTKTNKLIRELLSSFEKSIYLGYTATPYASIFISKESFHPKYGEDLFPKHFLVSIPQPSNYVGPEDLFGLVEDEEAGIPHSDGLPLIKSVTDTDEIIPGSHNSDLIVNVIPESLSTAIKTFILVCAIRRLRENGVPHNSMLIHVTRYTRVQRQIKDLVEMELKGLTARIMSGSDNLPDFRKILDEDLNPTSIKMKKKGFSESEITTWERIRGELYNAVRVIRIKVINGEVGDILEYRKADRETRQKIEKNQVVPWSERGVSFIVIGGDKLSRGLTLEGLTVSYYLRSARMYDTLMQMGRWFGYRDGYNDLSRLFITEELREWYAHIALANRELRDEFDYMDSIGSTPEKFGLKVRTHPGQLMITSAGKSRATETIRVTYAGNLVQTIIFDPKQSRYNIALLERLIESIGGKPAAVDPRKPRFKWDNVSSDLVVRFLTSYVTHPDARVIGNPEKYAEYIRKQNKVGELVKWTVILSSNVDKEKTHEVLISGYRVKCVKRKANLNVTRDKISIGVLTNRADEMLDLDSEEMEKARASSHIQKGSNAIPFGPSIRQARPAKRGLLLLYLPESTEDEEESFKRYGGKGDEILGFAISFPGSENSSSIEYEVNSVFAEEMRS